MNQYSYKRALFLLFACIITSYKSYSQVGINTTDPRATLEIGGNMKVSGDFDVGVINPLEDADVPTLLARESNNKIKVFDVTNPTGVALGYLQTYVIFNADGDWIDDYDTRIDASLYTLSISSAVFNSELKITFGSLSDNFSFASTSAFISGGTWHLKADYPSADPVNSGGSGTWTIQLVIFSNDLSKQFTPITIPMSGNFSGSRVTPIID